MNSNTDKLLSIFFFSALVFLQSCKNHDPGPAIEYDVPSTYNFVNVDYKAQSNRLVMMAQIEALMNSGNVAGGGSNISVTTLNNMFMNSSSPFAADSLNSSGVQLRDQVLTSAVSVLQGYLSTQATISKLTTSASDGVAGVGTTQTSTYILLDENGHNNRQLFTKTAMVVLLSHQIIALVNNILDNTTVVTGQGTAMEHAWDEAFGYFDVPKNFPTSVTGIKYLGSYCNQVNGGIGSDSIFMNAFLKGRAAISNKDITTKNAQAAIIVKELEIMIAAAAIHEIGEAKEFLTDDVQRVSRFSECMGFVLALKYFDNRTITDDQIDTIYNTYLHGGELYEITTEDMNGLVSTFTAIYGFIQPDKI